MDKILSNIRVYDLEESLVASGYPMRTINELHEVTPQDKKRCETLTKASRLNGAHGQYLTGIRVNFDVTFTNKVWVEAERYRFFEFVSSQSTMHRITEFDLSKSYNEYVDKKVIKIVEEKVKEYKLLKQFYENIKDKESDLALIIDELLKNKYREILYTNPAGFKITARMTTNYRCLLNMYNQRHNHRLPEWQQFCKELLEELPEFENLVNIYMDKEN